MTQPQKLYVCREQGEKLIYDEYEIIEENKLGYWIQGPRGNKIFVRIDGPRALNTGRYRAYNCQGYFNTTKKNAKSDYANWLNSERIWCLGRARRLFKILHKHSLFPSTSASEEAADE